MIAVEFTIEAKSRAGLSDHDADGVLDRLLRDPRALGVGGIGIEENGGIFAIFQVEADSAVDAARVGGGAFERVLGAPRGRVVDLHVYAGGPREVEG